jgi:hypothetical protein
MIRIARPKLRTLGIVALPIAAVAITVPTVAMAIGGSPAVFQGCLYQGDISRVTTSTTAPDCTGMGGGILPSGVGTLITWNEQGVQGAAGPGGVAGPAGPAGPAGSAGPAGAAGAIGLTGPAGKNGVSGFQLINTHTRAAARTAATYTVHCPTGKYALGGGMSGTSDLVLNGSSPTSDAKGWVVRVTNVGQKNRTIHVYVTCAVAG